MHELQHLLETPTFDATHVVVVIDLDGLKAINDTHGHQAGDAALVAVADCLRVDDAIVGRYGGDEFVAILAHAGRDEGHAYIDAVRGGLDETLIDLGSDTPPIAIAASIGISVYPQEAIALRSLIELADSRMYAAKRQRPSIRPLRAA